MPDTSSLLPAAIPEKLGVAAFTVVVLVAIIAVYLGISLLTDIVRHVHRKILQRGFLRQFGITVPADVKIKKNKSSTTTSYVLRCPVWKHAKSDGTRDRRYKSNPIVRRLSVMRTGEWELSSYDPLAMNSLVVAFRKEGNAMPLCQQEMAKYSLVSAGRRNQFVGASEVQLYAHFMNDSDGFEEWCAQLLRDNGAKVRVTPSSNDGGYDLDIHANGARAIAECKCYHPTEGSVGRPLLQKLVGANASEHAQQMIFMTTSRYSAPAIEYAKEQDITLLDGKTLIRMDAARRGRTPVPRHASPEWLLTDDDVKQGYPSDYSGRYGTQSRLPVSAFVFLAKVVLLVGLAYVLTQAKAKYADELNPNAIWAELSSSFKNLVTMQGQEPEGTGISETKASESVATNEYVLPGSDYELLPQEELMSLSSHDLFVARNEIYARHGCVFETESLRQHFQNCTWYVPRTPSAEFDDGVLSMTEQENIQRILGVETPKNIGSATYVATYFTREYAEDHPEWSCAYNGHVNGDLLQIEGTWDIAGGNETELHNCTTWCFRLDRDVQVQSSGGDATDSNLRTMSRAELQDMLGSPSGLGLRLVTNDAGEVTEIGWMS